MANRYYVYYPRDFNNEYTVYVVENDENERRLLHHFPTAERITRKQALRLGRTWPNEARATGQHWAGGFARSSTYDVLIPTDREYISAAIDGTYETLAIADDHAAYLRDMGAWLDSESANNVQRDSEGEA